MYIIFVRMLCTDSRGWTDHENEAEIEEFTYSEDGNIVNKAGSVPCKDDEDKDKAAGVTWLTQDSCNICLCKGEDVSEHFSWLNSLFCLNDNDDSETVKRSTIQNSTIGCFDTSQFRHQITYHFLRGRERTPVYKGGMFGETGKAGVREWGQYQHPLHHKLSLNHPHDLHHVNLFDGLPDVF